MTALPSPNKGQRESLYVLTEELVALDSMLAEIGGDVSSPEGQTLEKWAAEFDWKMRDKVDGYASLAINLEADALTIANEVKRLQARKNAIENRRARLLALAKFSMERLQVRKLEGVRFTIAIQKNGGVEPLEVLVATDQLPDKFYSVEEVYTADTDLLRKALEARRAALAKTPPDPDPFPELAGKAELKERGESVRVR